MTEAFVLRRRPYGEKDFIVDFLMASGEQATGFARAARNSVKRFPHQFRLTGLYELEFSRSSKAGQLRPIQNCELITHYSEIDRLGLLSLTRWSGVLEWCREESESDIEFSFLKSMAEKMNQGFSLEAHLEFLRFSIERHGLSPDFENCGFCQKPLGEERDFGFSRLRAEISHATCGGDLRLSQEARAWWRGDETQLSKESALDLEKILHFYLESQLGKSLRSWKVLREIHEEPPAVSQTHSRIEGPLATTF